MSNKLPNFPDVAYESALRAFILKTWPRAKFVNLLEDVGRSLFYEDYDPHFLWHTMPISEIHRVVCFAKARREERGFPYGAKGIINSLKKSDWFEVAEDLANLSWEDYNRLIQAFALYREVTELEKEKERGRFSKKEFPPRSTKTKKG